MNQGTAGSHLDKTLPWSALDDAPPTPIGGQVTPSTLKKRFKLASISAKSKRFLSFRGSASKERGSLSTMSSTSPPHTSPSDAIGDGQVSAPGATPAVSTPKFSPEAQSEVVRGYDESSGDPLSEAPRIASLNFPVQDLHDPESPTLNLAQKKAKSGERTSEIGCPVQLFCIDNAQLSYAKSMEALSNDFAAHVFPESPLFATEIPKSEINIPYPSIPVSLGRRKSLGVYTFGSDAALLETPLNIELPADIKMDALAEEAPSRLSPVAEVAEDAFVENRSSWLHLAQTVQRAAKHLSDDEDLSPLVLFQTLGPIVLLLYGISAGVLLKRYHNELYVALGLTGALKPVAMFVIVVAGAIAALVILKLTILMSTSLLNTFSEIDLETAFHKGECVDADGKAVGESDLLLGSFLFASPSSPVVA